MGELQRKGAAGRAGEMPGRRLASASSSCPAGAAAAVALRAPVTGWRAQAVRHRHVPGRSADRVARAGARALAVCDRRDSVPELALQRGDRHRVQANKPNTTLSTALQNFTSALSSSSLVRRNKKLNGISSKIYEKRHVVSSASVDRAPVSLVWERGAAAGS